MAKTVFGMPGAGNKPKDATKASNPISTPASKDPLASLSRPAAAKPAAAPMAKPMSASTPVAKTTPTDSNRTMFGMPAMKLQNQSPAAAPEPETALDPKQAAHVVEELRPMYAATQAIQAAGPRGAATVGSSESQDKIAFKETVLGMAAVRPESESQADTQPPADDTQPPADTQPPLELPVKEVPPDMAAKATPVLGIRAVAPRSEESWTDAGIHSSKVAERQKKKKKKVSVPLEEPPPRKSKKTWMIVLIIAAVLTVIAVVTVMIISSSTPKTPPAPPASTFPLPAVPSVSSEPSAAPPAQPVGSAQVPQAPIVQQPAGPAPAQ